MLATPSGTRRRRSGPRTVIAVLAACGIAVSVMQTLVVPLLGEFPRLLDTSPANATWLVTSTLLAGAVCAPVLGRLGDMYGKRRMLLLALVLMTLGSALGALTDEFTIVLVARVLQGAAMGVIPLGISIMRDELPAEQVGSGTALMSSTLGIGGAVGLPVAGLVAQHGSWHLLFAGAAVLGVIDILLVLTLVRESELRSGGRFDALGAAGLSAALVCLLLVISKGHSWGFTSPTTVGVAVAAVVLFGAWGCHELRVPAPLVDLRISASPAVLLTNLASVLVGFAMFAAFVVSAQMLQAPAATGYGFEASLVLSGILLLPIGIMMTVFSPVSAGLSRRRGPRTTLITGAAILVLGNLARAFVHGHVALLVLGVTVIAVGAALAYSAMPTLIMSVVPTSETAAANSLNALMRTVGTSSCSAVVAAVSGAYTVDVAGVAYPSQAGYSAVFVAAAVAALGAVLLAIAVPAGCRPVPVPEPASPRELATQAAR